MSERNSSFRTTILLDNEDRELIKKSGKTISDFFADLMIIFKRMSINNWTDGLYMIDDRFCLINQRNINQFINKSNEDLQNMGRIIGKGFRETIVLENPEITIKTLSDHLNKLLRWGRVCIQNNNKRIVFREPIIPKVEFNRGFLESFFNMNLEVSDPNEYRQVFEVKNH